MSVSKCLEWLLCLAFKLWFFFWNKVRIRQINIVDEICYRTKPQVPEHFKKKKLDSKLPISQENRHTRKVIIGYLQHPYSIW